MGYKRIHVCDSCGSEFKGRRDTYSIGFYSLRYTDAAGDRDYDAIKLELCEHCARRAVDALEKIAEEGRACDG